MQVLNRIRLLLTAFGVTKTGKDLIEHLLKTNCPKHVNNEINHEINQLKYTF